MPYVCYILKIRTRVGEQLAIELYIIIFIKRNNGVCASEASLPVASKTAIQTSLPLKSSNLNFNQSFEQT